VSDYQVPITRLPADPVHLMELLVAMAGVRTCGRPGCGVRWVGGDGHRLYCSTDCARQVNREREAWRRRHAKGQQQLVPVDVANAMLDGAATANRAMAQAMGRGAHEGSTDE